MKIFGALIVATTLVVLPGCGNKTIKNDPENVKIENKIAFTKEQKLANAYLANMNKLADALDNVKDEKSAAKAAKAIHALGEEMDALEEKYGEKIGEKQMVAIMMSRQSEFMAVQQRVSANMLRLATTNSQLMQTISKEVDAAGLGK